MRPISTQAAKAIDDAGGPAPLTIAGDLRTLAGCEQVFKSVNDKFKRCDILVNNAGATKGGNFFELPDEAFLDGFALKYFAAVRLTGCSGRCSRPRMATSSTSSAALRARRARNS